MPNPHRRGHGFKIGTIPLTLKKRTIDVMFGDEPSDDVSNNVRHRKSFHEVFCIFTIGLALTGISRCGTVQCRRSVFPVSRSVTQRTGASSRRLSQNPALLIR